jgi:hypothetical protein
MLTKQNRDDADGKAVDSSVAAQHEPTSISTPPPPRADTSPLDELLANITIPKPPSVDTTPIDKLLVTSSFQKPRTMSAPAQPINLLHSEEGLGSTGQRRMSEPTERPRSKSDGQAPKIGILQSLKQWITSVFSKKTPQIPPRPPSQAALGAENPASAKLHELAEKTANSPEASSAQNNWIQLQLYAQQLTDQLTQAAIRCYSQLPLENISAEIARAKLNGEWQDTLPHWTALVDLQRRLQSWAEDLIVNTSDPNAQVLLLATMINMADHAILQGDYYTANILFSVLARQDLKSMIENLPPELKAKYDKVNDTCTPFNNSRNYRQAYNANPQHGKRI